MNEYTEYYVELHNGADIDRLIEILKKYNVAGMLRDNTYDWKVQATTLGALAALEWDEVILMTECPTIVEYEKRA